jgi:hypothetical protein
MHRNLMKNRLSKGSFVSKKLFHDELIMMFILVAILYVPFMTGSFFFFEFDMMNRLCREYFGLVPHLSVPYLIPYFVNYIGSACVVYIAGIIASTFLLFVSSSTSWFYLLNPAISFKTKQSESLKLFSSFQIMSSLGNSFMKRLAITFHHTGFQIISAIVTFTYIRYPEYQTVATLVGFPILLWGFMTTEYLEIDVFTRTYTGSEMYIKGMKTGFSQKGYWKRVLRPLKPIAIEVYYPIMKTNKKCFSHFVFSYTMNTSDLLLTFP